MGIQKKGLHYLSSRRKRLLDLVGAGVILSVSSPVMLAIFAGRSLENAPVIFKQKRVGRGGDDFICPKFRSMVVNADSVLRNYLEKNPSAREEWSKSQKLRVDPRVDRLGSFIRRTSLDELPQLFTVLKGDMSLVGPRPILREEISRYNRAAPAYMNCKPGLTGVWQTSGRSDLDYKRRVAMDRHYAISASLSYDVHLLIKTIGVLISLKGAY